MVNLCFINVAQEAVDVQNSSTTCEDHLGRKRSTLSSNFLNLKTQFSEVVPYLSGGPERTAVNEHARSR